MKLHIENQVIPCLPNYTEIEFFFQKSGLVCNDSRGKILIRLFLEDIVDVQVVSPLESGKVRVKIK